MEQNSRVTQQNQQSLKVSPIKPRTAQAQKITGKLKPQQKAGQTSAKTVDTLRRAKSDKQPATVQTSRTLVKDSSLKKSAVPNPLANNKKSPVARKKQAVIQNKTAVPVNKKLQLQQQQLSHQAEQVFSKEQKLYHKLEELIIEQQRLIREQKKLLREIEVLRMKLKLKQS
jgi:hypothetical protein